MIQLQFENVNVLWQEIDRKISGIEEIMSDASKSEIAKAVFTITAKRFLKDFAIESNRNPLKYHHVFEWDNVGNLDQKLFKVKRKSLGRGDLRIELSFQPSKTNVPIPRELTTPSRTGKAVTRRSVFRNKAEVMESGRPVTFRTKRYIAFLSDSQEIKFMRPRKLIQILNPGGRQVAGSFERFAERWYATKVDSTLRSSGLFKNIGKSVAIALNQKRAGKEQARQAIVRVTRAYSEGAVEF